MRVRSSELPSPQVPARARMEASERIVTAPLPLATKARTRSIIVGLT